MLILTRRVDEAIVMTTCAGEEIVVRVLGVTPAYLCRLRQGAKIGPSDALLRKLGLSRTVSYSWRKP